MVDTGRLAPSAMNLQPLEFVLIDDPEMVEQVFVNTRWAGYLPKGTGAPPKGQQPTAFIVILVNTEIGDHNWIGHDVGAGVENMTLAALSEGIGSCWIGSVNKDAVARIIELPKTHRIDSVLALGYPDEQPVPEVATDSIKYYKDENDVLHVPKRKFDDVFHLNLFYKEK